MKDLKIAKFNRDFKLCLTPEFNLIFTFVYKKNLKEKTKPIPILLDDEMVLIVGHKDEVIKDFLEHKNHNIYDKDVLKFFEIAQRNIIVFLVAAIKELNIDILFYDGLMIVNNQNKNNYHYNLKGDCFYFNNKMIPYDSFDRIDKAAMSENYKSVYIECMDDLSYFIKSKINNNLNNNATIFFALPEFKEINQELSLEFGKKIPDIVKILELYYSLIYLKSEFFKKKEYALPDNEIIEVTNEFEILKGLTDKKFNIKTDSVDL